MVKHFRKLAALTVVAALMVVLVGNLTRQTTDAANLTSGTYTYVINGEEVMFPVDPVKVSSGLLLPAEVFEQFGVTVEGALRQVITLQKPGVTIVTTVGRTTAQINGAPKALEQAPLRLAGRVFLPAGLLRHLGIEMAQDGSMLVLREYTAGRPTVIEVSAADYNQLRQGKFFHESVKADSGVFLGADFTLMSPDMISASQFAVDYGTRARLQSLAATHTLVSVKLSNTTVKAGAIVSNGIFLVDDKRRQYDLSEVIDLGEGLITAKITPGADRVGLLVFPRIAADAAEITVYYDPNGTNVGTFYNPH